MEAWVWVYRVERGLQRGAKCLTHDFQGELLDHEATSANKGLETAGESVGWFTPRFLLSSASRGHWGIG